MSATAQAPSRWPVSGKQFEVRGTGSAEPMRGTVDGGGGCATGAFGTIYGFASFDFDADADGLVIAEGYVAVVMNVKSRRVIGLFTSEMLSQELASAALREAAGRQRPSAGWIHHSDRGSQYASKEYTELLKAQNIRISMSRKGSPYDNALAESFLATFKTECFEQMPQTHAETRLWVFDYLETFYNPKRLHSALGYRSPVEFENQFS